MYFVKTPWYLKSIYPSLLWNGKQGNTIYLTFDDGPIPGVTDEVLKILADYEAVATFFVIGDNVRKNQDLYNQILTAGHKTGNHTYHHLNGWKTANEMYFSDVASCGELVRSELFRPPYGRIGYQQIQGLKKMYRIIMWDVLSGDFDTTIDGTQCADNVIENAVDGSIVVFHDSEKAKDRLLPALPVVLGHFRKRGFQFATL